LLHVWGLLGEIERRVVLLVAQRILMGQSEYGKLRGPETDRRDLVREEGEEVADALVYSATREVYRRMGGDG
jgi:hypothetical protein